LSSAFMEPYSLSELQESQQSKRKAQRCI
jgi:hypothetical protein